MDDFSREDRLGKKLVALYGLTIGSCWHGSTKMLRISDPETRIYSSFLNWHSVLFGQEHVFVCSHKNSLNEMIVRYFNPYKSMPISIIEYSSLDELDIQLTLLGMNG